jgi:glycosyltransferase involved in cell wall biosynthesis
MTMASRSVLYVAEPTTAGLAQCLSDWTAGLVDRGWRVSLACPSTGWLADACRSHGVMVYQWEATGEAHKGIPRELKQLRSAIRLADPDVVHLNGAKAGFIGRWSIRGRRPTAFSPHSWAVEATSGVKAAAGLQWERFATRWTDTLIAVSEAEAEAGRGYGIGADYTVAHNGLNLTDVSPAADRPALRESLGISSDQIAVVCVGRMHRQKGQDVLLQAWPNVAGSHRQLYLVGDGPLLDAMRASNARPDVHFVGNVGRAESLAWMQAADVVVVPSRWEGMALVPLESLAVGTPVVASDVTGVREAVGGVEFGQLVPPGNAESLAQALNAWLTRIEQHPGSDDSGVRQSRRLWVSERFDVDATVRIISDTLTQLVEAKTPHRSDVTEIG